MTQTKLPTLSERLKTSADAKKALVALFRPRAAAIDPNFEDRAALRAAELDRVRQARASAKTAKKLAVEQAQADALNLEALAAEADLIAKRGERKERKALTKAEAKTKRDARYAARKARQDAPRGRAAHAA